MNTAGFRSVFLGIALFAAACTTAVEVTPAATQILIPATATDTPTPVTPTATQPLLSRPDEIGASTPDASALIPAIAQPLVNQALNDLAAELELERDNIGLVRFEAATWETVDLGCGEGQALEGDSLAIEGFRLVLEAAGELYEYHTDSQSAIRRCEQAGVVAGTTSTLLELDPVAAELVFLAQRRLGEELDLPTRRIRLVDVVPVTWPDSSLGCPSPDQEYAQFMIEGYRIVLQAGPGEYIFHTDPERLIECDAADEVLPGAEPVAP